MGRILRATRHTWNGLIVAIRGEAAFRDELIVLAVLTPFAFVVTESGWLRLLLICVVIGVMAIELVNSAIEKLADRVTREHDPLIGAVKDMGSAAVGLAIVIAVLVWLFAIAIWLGLA